MTLKAHTNIALHAHIDTKPKQSYTHQKSGTTSERQRAPRPSAAEPRRGSTLILDVAETPSWQPVPYAIITVFALKRGKPRPLRPAK